MDRYLKETKMLDFNNINIQNLINERNWKKEDDFHKIQLIYNFIRDEILFGYNVDDNISASEVLKDGYGQCNTKGTLFMSLLRGFFIPCRIHGFTIDKKLQKGAMTGLVYFLAPKNGFHSYGEVYLEGFILDKKYLSNLQKIFNNCTAFCGYGVAVKDFKNPQIDFNRNDTYIQIEGINNDYGRYDSPYDLLAEHGQNISKLKQFVYKNFARHLMNRNGKK